MVVKFLVFVDNCWIGSMLKIVDVVFDYIELFVVILIVMVEKDLYKVFILMILSVCIKDEMMMVVLYCFFEKVFDVEMLSCMMLVWIVKLIYFVGFYKIKV